MKDTAFILSGAQLVTHNQELDLSTGKSAGGLRTIADPSDVITGSTLISVVGGPGRLEAHSLVTGALLWKSQPFAETTTSAVWSAAVGDGEVLVATDARTMALSLRSGRLDWSDKHGGVNPVFAHDRFYVPRALSNEQNRILKARTGELIANTLPGAPSHLLSVTRRSILYVANGELDDAPASCSRLSCPLLWSAAVDGGFYAAAEDGRVVVDDAGALSSPHLVVLNERSGGLEADLTVKSRSATTVLANHVILRLINTTGTLEARSLANPKTVLWRKHVVPDTSTVAGEIGVAGSTVVVDSNGYTTALRLPRSLS